MKLWRLLMVAMATLVCFACSEDTTESEPLQVLELTGEIMPIDEDAESRAQAVDNSDGSVGVYWLPSDHIGVYTSKGTENADFRSTTMSKTNKATFRGSISGTPAYAYFPYRADAGNDMTAVKATFEPYQYYSTADKELTNDFKIGTYDRKFLYINYFSFTHIFSFFRVKVDATGTTMVDEQLEKVILTFPEGVLPSGDFTMNLPAKSYTWSGNNYEKNQLVLEFTDKPTLEADVVIQGYLSVPAMSLAGKSIGISVRSTNKEAVYNNGKSIAVDIAGNKTYTLTMDLDDGHYTIADRPAINSLSFTAANNEGKILASKLSYSKSTSSGWFGSTKTEITVSADTSESATTQVMTIDDENNTITGCIPYLFDRNLVPTFSYPNSCTLSYSYDGGESFTEWDGGEIDFSAGTVIRVANSSVSRDYKVNITNTGLPVVVVNQPDGDTDWSYSDSGFLSSSSISVETGLKVWSKATDFDNIEKGNVTVYNADGTINAEGAGVTRLRGNTTLDMPKKPFAIKFDSKTSVLGMPAHKRWVLLANMKDRSLMRNHIAFGVANKFSEIMPSGIPWHPHGEFVELVYNGVHVGHYYLCEQIKINKNRVDIQDEYDGESITADNVGDFGYLLECDDYYDENTKFMTKHYIPFQFKDDGDDAGIILNYVQTKVQAIEDNLYAGYKGDATGFTNAYADMHVESFVDQLLIYEMTMNSEFGHPRSLYMVMDGEGPLAAGPVWDFDWLSFPLDNDTQKSLESTWDRDLSQSLMTTPSHINQHYVSSTVPTASRTDDVPYHWYPMLITDANFKALAAERWARIKPYLATYANEILVQGERIALSWEYNNAIWPAYDCEAWRTSWCDGGFCGDELFSTYEEVYQGMYEAYNKRLSGMDFVTNQDWPTWTIE